MDPQTEQLEERMARVAEAAERDKEHLIERALERLENEMRARPAEMWARVIARAINRGERITMKVEIVPESAMRREMQELLKEEPSGDSAP